MKKAVVIGAGQTGRGYVARYLKLKNYQITFIDNNEELVSLMKKDSAYTIHFYNKDATPVHIDKYDVWNAHSEEAKKAIFETDYIFTAVGEQNLGDVAVQIVEGCTNKKTLTKIITCENGINPKKVLKNKIEELSGTGDLLFSQTAVFCSTVKLIQTRLDILSQNETYFPYDDTEFDDLDFYGTQQVHDFEKFLKRKIYTYNCLAGLISYLGYIKKYEVFGEAANDTEISKIMDDLLIELNPALADYFDITLEEQTEFSKRALAKFKDLSILDYTVKNGRDAHRKLGPTERIMAPMNIMKLHSKDFQILELVAAAAVVYWKEQQGNGREVKPKEGFIEDMAAMNKNLINEDIIENIKSYIKKIENVRNEVKLYDIL